MFDKGLLADTGYSATFEYWQPATPAELLGPIVPIWPSSDEPYYDEPDDYKYWASRLDDRDEVPAELDWQPDDLPPNVSFRPGITVVPDPNAPADTLYFLNASYLDDTPLDAVPARVRRRSRLWGPRRPERRKRR